MRRRSSPWPCRRRMHTMRSRTSRRPSSRQGVRRPSSARATMRAPRRPHLVVPYSVFNVSNVSRCMSLRAPISGMPGLDN